MKEASSAKSIEKPAERPIVKRDEPPETTASLPPKDAKPPASEPAVKLSLKPSIVPDTKPAAEAAAQKTRDTARRHDKKPERTAKSHNAQPQRDARAHKERKKPARVVERRKVYVDNSPRSFRAGSRETSFSDIWR